MQTVFLNLRLSLEKQRLMFDLEIDHVQINHRIVVQSKVILVQDIVDKIYILQTDF